MDSSQASQSEHHDDPVKKLREEFNQQRARMKELYLQKEGECRELQKKLTLMKKELDDSKSQLVIADYTAAKDLEELNRKHQDEIQTLQQLITETFEENDRIKQEFKELKDTLATQAQQAQDTKNPIFSVTKLAKKFNISSNTNQESVEEVKTVPVRYAQEDAEVLRSLVIPLEDEIVQLKEKLRGAYEEMEKVKGSVDNKKPQSAMIGLLKEGNPSEESTKPVEAQVECEQCKDYETKLVQAQESINVEKEKLVKLEKTIERLREDLEKECKLRIDLEAKWQEKRELHKTEVRQLTESLQNSEQKVKTIWENFEQFKNEINQEILKLIDERQQVYENLDTLQKDNEYLSGCYLDNSQFLKDQVINLPQSIGELHELVLNLHENLIVSKTASEFHEAKCISYRDESNLLRDQINMREKERMAIEHRLNSRIQSLDEKLKHQQQQYQKLLNEKEELQRIEVDYKKQTSELRMQNIELNEANDRLEKNNQDLKGKISLIQQELATNETVQKDFVRLSQSLQMQLEKIRSADTQVRWQDEDDVDFCPNCKKEFAVTRRKQHCRHCGTIYCQNCLNKIVKSGPNMRPAKVCEVCHYLLEQNTAPYFSDKPPQSPI